VSKRSNGVFMGSTEVPTVRTISDISAALVRVRATHISTEYEHAGGGAQMGRAKALSFSLDVNGVPVWFRLPCRAERLFGKFSKEQADRVAWRQILRWVEAQVALIDSGMVAPPEIFMPYSIEGLGGVRTLYEVWKEQIKALPAPEKGQAAG
jgi:hypothetical protein